MTPKQKAEELFDKMSTNNGDEHHHCTYYVAKQCALIAVDEILKEYREDYEEINKDIYTIYSWWQEVKQEIDKIPAFKDEKI